MGLGQGERGYAMAALLIGMTIMAVMMSAALPVWSQYTKREKEEELIWRGQQYARAIGLFQRKYANTFPPNVDVLIEQKFLRKKYKDPITGEDFQPIPATGMPGGGVIAAPPGSPIVPGGTAPAGTQGTQGMQGTRPSAGQSSPAGPRPRMTSVGTTMQAGVGIQGVVSKSTDSSIKIFNGRTKYNEWAFVPMVTAQGIQGAPPGSGPAPGPTGPDGRPRPFSPVGGSPRRPGVQSPDGQPIMPGTTMPGGTPGQTAPPGQRPPRPPGN